MDGVYQRRARIPSSVPMTNYLNISNSSIQGGHHLAQPWAHWPITAGSCVPGLVSQPTIPSPSCPPFSPGIRGDRSRYPHIQLIGSSDPCSDIQIFNLPCCCFGTPPGTPRPRPVPLPAQITDISAVTLNPALRVPSAKSKSPKGALLAVDFAHAAGVNPELIILAEPATWPGLPSLTLLSHRLPWSITAHASERWVTVGDVLKAISEALCIRVTKEQFDEWLEQDSGRWLKRKAQDYPNARGKKQKRVQQMTRLDLFEGKHTFAGLSESEMGCDVWLLNVT
ncbi:hypothetical protein B0H11DRAFT_55514 [Mycena galericulata]|nr:hypothetical protein B0H11DRAFT_55514 [Mycena galericulata]